MERLGAKPTSTTPTPQTHHDCFNTSANSCSGHNFELVKAFAAADGCGCRSWSRGLLCSLAKGCYRSIADAHYRNYYVLRTLHHCHLCSKSTTTNAVNGFCCLNSLKMIIYNQN